MMQILFVSNNIFIWADAKKKNLKDVTLVRRQAAIRNVLLVSTVLGLSVLLNFGVQPRQKVQTDTHLS